ncbi:MAG: hypothetical protein JSS07_02950 [Proteobacteria bacterium]|nr:hypothetical protein [Pseudomonadota bacterium]
MKLGANEINSKNENSSLNKAGHAETALSSQNNTTEKPQCAIQHFTSSKDLFIDQTSLLIAKFESVFSTQKPLSEQMWREIKILL